MSGWKAKFVHELQKRHQCPQCSLALRLPMQTECGHLFCKGCLEPLLEKPYPLCPVDQERISQDTTFPDNACRREVLQLYVYCKYAPDCDWIGELKKLEVHIENCNFREIQCTLCGKYISYPKLDIHQRTECPMRPSTCPHCHERVPIDQLSAHIEKVCPEYIRYCPNNCDSMKTYKLHELQKHLSIKEGDCPLQEIDCPFVLLGCIFKSKREQVDLHLDERKIYHAQLQVEAVISCTRKCEDQIQGHTEVMKRVDSLVSRDTALERRQKEFDARLEAEEMKTQSKLERLTLKITTLEEKITRLLIEEKQFQSQSPFYAMSSSSSGPNPSSLSSMSSMQRLDQLYSKVSEIDSTLTQCITNSMDFDVRLQFVERASHDGTMLWKIDNLTQHRQEAIDGTTLSLYSVPFYTHKQGYKMCARVYLNGDGLGKGTHLSLFFVIMKGTNDALLKWPFEQKVTLVLINQNGKRDVIDQFRPDPHSSSFQRPIKREMNIASGCPRFCRLDQLKEGFIKDDAIFIGLIVETSNLKPPVSI